jgi:polyisoprenoid-binding protein YceI
MSFISGRAAWLLCCATVALAAGRATSAEEPTHYRVVAGDSELSVLVFRAGALGKLGHNHVVSSNGMTGTVLVGATPQDSSFDLTLDVDSLEVDDPEARADAGSVFEGTVDQEDIEGTRRNMLSARLLDAENHKEVRIVSSGISGEFADMTIDAQITIRGESHNVQLPVSAAVYGDRLVASGRTDISHEQLGLTPFTAALGALSVADVMTFRYRVVAVRE